MLYYCFRKPLRLQRVKCISFEGYSAKPTITDLNDSETHYYPFMVNLKRCGGSCNTLYDLSAKICIPNKIEDVNLKLLNVITGINERKSLVKHIFWHNI